QVHPKVSRFGPSTPIHERLRGAHLQMFWDRLHWITNDQIPLPYHQIRLRRGGFFLKIGVGLLNYSCNQDVRGFLISLAATVCLFLALAWLVKLLNRQLNPLPKEIQSFGDLARYLAVIISNPQSEAASCSTP